MVEYYTGCRKNTLGDPVFVAYWRNDKQLPNPYTTIHEDGCLPGKVQYGDSLHNAHGWNACGDTNGDVDSLTQIPYSFQALCPACAKKLGLIW